MVVDKIYPTEDDYIKANRVFDELQKIYSSKYSVIVRGSHDKNKNRKEEIEEKLDYWFSNEEEGVKKALSPYYKAIREKSQVIVNLEFGGEIKLPPLEKKYNSQWEALFNTMVLKISLDLFYLQSSIKKNLNITNLGKNLFTEGVKNLFEEYKNHEVITLGTVRSIFKSNPKNPRNSLKRYEKNFYELLKKYEEDPIVDEETIKWACQNSPKNTEDWLENFKKNVEFFLKKNPTSNVLKAKYICKHSPEPFNKERAKEEELLKRKKIAVLSRI